MSPNLVGPPCAYTNFEEGKTPKVFDLFPVGQSAAPGAQVSRHTCPVPGVSRNRLPDPSRPGEFAFHQSKVSLFHLARGKLKSQILVCRVRLSHKKHACSEPIQPVHNPGPDVSPHGRQRLEPMQQRVDDRSTVNPGPGMDHHARGLMNATPPASS